LNTEICFEKEYFQLLQLGDQKNGSLLILYRHDEKSLRLMSVPMNSEWHKNISRWNERQTSSIIIDFHVDSQFDNSKTILPEMKPVIPLVYLIENSPSWKDSEIQIFDPEINALQNGLRLALNPRIIKLSEIDLESKVRAKFQVPLSEIKCKPTNVRYCSRLKKVFLFGFADDFGKKPQEKYQEYLFLVVFDLEGCDSNDSILVHEIFLEEIQMGKPPQMNHNMAVAIARNKLMPPIPRKIMISENPSLHNPGASCETLFVFGAANEAAKSGLPGLFACVHYHEGKSSKIKVENINYILDRNLPADCRNVSSISLNCLNKDTLITVAYNRIQVITVRLKASKMTTLPDTKEPPNLSSHPSK
jgi:hypothetical protein